MSTVALRRFATVVTTLALTLSGLVFSPAQASVDGSYSCATGVKDGPAPRYEISALSVVQDSGKNCTGDVMIPEGVTSIGASAFKDATTIVSVSFPATLTSIGIDAFRGSSALANVFFIRTTATTVGADAFTGVASSAKAWIRAGATGYATAGNTWNGLVINLSPSGTYSCATGVKDGPTPRYTIANGTVNQETSKSCVGAVIVPDGVTTLATKAFFMVPNMTSITLPSTLRSIGVDAFRSSNKLTSINIPAGVTALDGAFYGDTALTTITFESDIAGSRLRTIGNETFEVTKLASINLPQGVESIGSSAFSNISTLTSITFPPSLTSIGAGAFRATPITSITIPANVSSIGDGAFQNMPLNTVTFESGSKLINLGASAFAGGQNITNFTFGTGSQLTTIGASAFQGLSQLTSITIPASATSIGQYAFFGTNNLNKITFESGSQLTTIGANAFEGSSLRNIVIPAGVTSIGNDAFRNVGSLWAVSFAGNSAPSVGLTTFLGIKNGARGFIKPGVTSFGTLGFNWNGLVIRESQLPPADNGDYSCATGELNGPGIKYTVFESQVTFGRNCTGSVVLAPGVLSIGDNAFQQTSITSIVIPEGVTQIGVNAFASAASLTSVTLPTSLKTIGLGAFSGTALTSITIPAGLTSIGQQAFQSATSLGQVRFLGDTAPSAGGSAFNGVKTFAVAVINASATGFGTIGSSWNGLEVIDIESLQSLPANGSYSCETGAIDGPGTKYQVTNGNLSGGTGCTGAVVIADGVRTIATNAFKDAPLATISIPASVTSIGANAFFDNNSLSSFTVDPANPNFSSIGGVLFNKNATTLLSFPFKSSATSYSIPAGVTTIANNAFRKATQLKSVTLPAGVTSIGASAFSEAYALTSINIPAGVTSIGSGAFGQTAITSINIPEGVTRIENSTFQYARQLISVTIPASVTSIGNEAFFGNVSLTSITFAPRSQLASIGFGAFWSSGIRAITIPANVTSLGGRAFQDTVRLETVNFEAGSKLTSIGEYAFYEAKVLTNISIPASVTTIGRQPFSATPKLTEYFFLGNAPATLHAEAFSGVAATAKGYIKTGATGFSSGSTWNGLAIVVGFYENVSFNSKGGSLIAARDFGGGIAEPTAPTRAGYTFAGWAETDGAATTVTFPYAPSETSNITLFAKWAGSTNTVAYDSKGGTAVANGSFTTGGNFTAPTAPTRAGYTFAGWTATDGGSTIVSFPYAPSETSNITLYAKWTQNLTKAVASTKPSLTGKAIATAKGTNKLTAAKGTWTGIPTPVITYQWYSCSAQVKATTSTIPKTCKAISKATKSTFAVTNSYKAKYLAVAVIGKGTGTTATTWLSKSTVKVK